VENRSLQFVLVVVVVLVLENTDKIEDEDEKEDEEEGFVFLGFHTGSQGPVPPALKYCFRISGFWRIK
jgi:hypothetical protein